MTIGGFLRFFEGLGLQDGSDINKVKKKTEETNTEGLATIWSFTNLYIKKQKHEQVNRTSKKKKPMLLSLYQSCIKGKRKI